MLLVFVLAGLALFYLSFTARHGRSRWPLHGLMSLGIISAGTALVILPSRIVETIMTTFPSPAGRPITSGLPPADPSDLLYATIAPAWFGFAAIFLGILALTRVVFGMVREPGPRF